jgi:hypothetical protein
MKSPEVLVAGTDEKSKLAVLLHRKIRNRVDKYFLSVLDDRLVELDDLAQLVLVQLEQYKRVTSAHYSDDAVEKSALDDFFKGHYALFEKQIQSRYVRKDHRKDFFDVQALLDAIEELMQDLPEVVRHEQSRERFYVQPGDRLRVRFLKPAKRFLYGISVFPRRFANVFRKLLGKEIMPVPFWLQHVPLKSWSTQSYCAAMVRTLADRFDAYMEAYASIANEIVGMENAISEDLLSRLQQINTDQHLDFEQEVSKANACRERIEKAKKAERRKVLSLLRQRFDLFQMGLQIAGTLEMPARRLSGRRVGKERKRAVAILVKKADHWFNAVFLAYRDWMFDLEIYGLVDRIWNEQAAIDRVARDRIRSKLLPALEKIRTSFAETRRTLQGLYDRGAEFRKQLLSEKLAVHREAETGATISLAQEVIDLDFPGLINGLQGKMHDNMNMLSSECWLVKKEKLLMPVRDSEIHVFSPLELLSFESVPNLEKALNKYKVGLVRMVGEISHEIESLPRILQFNLETALEVLEVGTAQQADAVKLTEEGFERIRNKLDDLEAMLGDFETSNRQALQGIARDFNKHVLELTDNENALNVRLRVTKAIALRRTVAYRQRILQKLQRGRTRARRYGKVFWRRFMVAIRPWQRKVGLHKEDEIAPELSDFLSYSYQVINGLPLVYRKLYSIHPLQSPDLFVDRDSELNQIQNALSNWQRGRYASTAVVGEKWSGLTSLINMALESIALKYKVFRISPEDSRHRTGDLPDLLGSVVGLEGEGDLDGLIRKIVDMPGKTVFVVEDLQKLYLRRVHGFAMLRDLFRIISATSDRVFWLCSCTRYAWGYLDLATGISGHFGYVIDLMDMKDQTITDIILRRNSISGYRIHYNPSAKLLKNKKFAALDEDSRQEVLKQQFFSNLNDFARSNISLALLYWLLSSQEITEEGIEIGHFEKPDFAFLDRMSISKTMGLFLLVVHDGLPSDLFSELMDMEERQGVMLLSQLVEDGLVVRKGEDYFVNTLLYRPAVNMLKSKNLIY